MRLLRSGKVKDIYELDGYRLLFKFSDRVSAFDVILPTRIPRKGEVLCKFAKFWFERLGVPHHMLEVPERDSMVVKRLRMIPVEFVVRGYLYGSLYERVKRGEARIEGEPVLAARLEKPIIDPTTKSDIKDVPITKEEVLRQGILTPDQWRYLESTSISIYEEMSKLAEKAGFIMADLKLEYGIDDEGRILLADSIGPDEFRIWLAESYAPGKTQESYDKQLIRDWLIKTGYKDSLEKARRENLPLPPPPELPDDLVREVAKRYITAYERITGARIDE